MTLRTRVARVDDYTGALCQSLDKLEIERSRGVLDMAEQVDFLEDLRQAVYQKDVLPYRRHARAGLLAGLAAAGLAGVETVVYPGHPALLLAILSAAALGLGAAAWNALVALRTRREDDAWLRPLEARVAEGGTLLD